MRILQVISSLNPTHGGPVEGLIQQGCVISEAGHEVHTLSGDAPGTEIDSRMESSAVFLLGPTWLKFGLCSRLEPWLRCHGPSYDIIIVHGLWQYHGYCVSKVARSIGLRYVVFSHGMLDPWFRRQYPLKHLKKWLYWPWVEYRVLKHARFLLFTSQEEMRLARESFWLFRARELLVGYGVRKTQVDKAAAREVFLAAYPQLRDRRCLLFLSRLHPKKGCDLLLDSFSRIAAADSRLHLIIAGPDSVGWQARLAAQTQRLGIAGRVTYPGMLQGSMKWGAYAHAEAFVLPSHQENFGIVLAEALASGVPVLTTYRVNIWREIVEADAGLVEEDTAEGIDRLLARWLAMTCGEQAMMRARTLPCFERHFDLHRITHRMLAALSLAASGRPVSYGQTDVNWVESVGLQGSNG